MTKSGFNITEISPLDPQLDAVKQIGRRNKKTLGFFPDGAFDDHASRGTLLVAHNPSKEILGYCAFRSSKGRAMIAHLCVDEPFRHNGIARLLFEGVKGRARQRDLLGIGLYCRRDYPGYDMWRKLGFVPRKSKPGRGMDGAELTFWWFDLDARTLWSDIEEADDRLLVAMDCNIFRDLHDTSEDRNQEATFLKADWLSGHIQLCVVDELFVEIDRLPLPLPRETWIKEAQLYRELKHDNTRFRTTYNELKTLFQHNAQPTPQEDSDMRYIAQAAAASADIFLTRDGGILEQGPEIEKRYGLQVKRPVELISGLNEAEQSAIYQPARFASTEVTRIRPKLEQIETLATQFHLPVAQESRTQFIAKLRTILSDPKCQTPLVAEYCGAPLFLTVFSQSGSNCQISLLRAVPTPLAATSLRHFLLEIISKRATDGGGRIEVIDPNLSQEIQTLMHELGFRYKSGRWRKLTLPFIGQTECIKKKVLNAFNESISAVEPHEMEALYWPAKILGGRIRTWVVPIQAGWATQLFETKFAEELLLPSRNELILSRENVYYSAAVQSGLRGSGRIVWYISKSADQPGSGSIRACSRLIKAHRGTAKALFKNFRRLGVFEWRDIMKITNDDPEREILALHFADTELFHVPLDYSLAHQFGIRNNFTSPVEVEEEDFAAIYKYGMNLNLSNFV